MKVLVFNVLFAAFVLLHDLKGNELFVELRDAQVILRPASPKVWGPGACTEITLAESKFAVRECPLDVKAKIEAARELK